MSKLTKDEKKRRIKWKIGEIYWRLRVNIKRALHIEPKIREIMHVLNRVDFIKYKEQKLGGKIVCDPLSFSEMGYYADKDLYIHGLRYNDHFTKAGGGDE